MNAKTIAWVLPHEGYDDEPLLAPLRAQGFRVVTCVAGATLPPEAELRVLQADQFGDSRRLRREYVMDARPTLIVASSAEQEVDALEFIKPRDDVVRGLRPVELLVLRLARLLKHAGGEALLQSLEFSDELTGLPNRKRWQVQLAQELGNTLSSECRAVVLFDLDHFKQINDHFGHLVGDQVIASVSQLIRDLAYSSCQLGRLGGEEFAVAMPEATPDEACAFAEKIRLAVSEHNFEVRGERRTITTSVGVAHWADNMQSSADLLRTADERLYRAKANGRNRVEV